MKPLLIDAKVGRDLAECALKTLQVQREYFYSKGDGDKEKLWKAREMARLLDKLSKEMMMLCGEME